MRPNAADVARSVVCLSVCLCVVRRLTHMGLRNHVLDRGRDQTNPFAAMNSDKTAMPSCQITFDTFYYY